MQQAFSFYNWLLQNVQGGSCGSTAAAHNWWGLPEFTAITQCKSSGVVCAVCMQMGKLFTSELKNLFMCHEPCLKTEGTQFYQFL
jgi:hypothetical protein